MNLTSVVGINWGDEGKGRMVDLLSKDFDIIARYQGGNNAGHTVINEKGKFILNLLPSGILSENVVNIMGGGMVIDLQHLDMEIKNLTKSGININNSNLKISKNAFICMPYHVEQDILEENRLKDKKFGSTRRGIAPAYSDKYLKKAIRMGDLLHLNDLKERINDILIFKNMILSAYGAKTYKLNDILDWLFTYSKPILSLIENTGEYLTSSIKQGKRIMFEAQLGALRDIDYGIYPFTTSSPTLSQYATIGCDIPSFKINHVIGITKAYSSCVGEGPFVVEMFKEEAEQLRKYGNEYGAATGRPRRVGAFDVVASRYGISIQGANEIALTKLDVLSYLDKIPVCTAYKIDSKIVKTFPFGQDLYKAQPIYEYLDGFKTDINRCRSKSDLPINALKYIEFLEKSIDCPIKYVSVGAKREDYIILR